MSAFALSLALGTVAGLADFLDKHQLHGISLEHIRRDHIVQEALATGADPLHLSLVFNIDHTNAMAYAHAAQPIESAGEHAEDGEGANCYRSPATST